MGIEIDFGRELGRLAFPDDVTEEQAQGYVRDNYQAIRQGLLAQRQEQLAAETTAEEAAKLRAGDVGTLETVGGQLYEAPRAAGRMLGQAAKGFARIFEAGAPEIEVTPEERAAILARSPITQAGERIVTAAEELPVIPGVEQTIPGQVMGGVGSVAGLIPATLVGGPVAGAAVYGLSAGEQAAEDARRTVNRRIAERLSIGDVAGADALRSQLPQLETAAFGITAPIGAVTEGALGLAGKIGRVGPGRPTIGGIGSKLAEAMIPKAASVRTQNMIRGGIEGAVTEGLQESLEQTLGNMAAKVTYDPERGVMDGVAQAGFIGAASGGFIGGTIGSRKNLGAANAVAEAVGADPGNPLPRSTATLAGIQDGPQPTGPILIEPEVTPEEVLRMSQELGIPVPEEVIPTPAAAAVPTPAPEAVPAPQETPAPAPVATAVAAPTPAVAPEAVVPPAAPTELEPDEQAELDALIEKEAAGTLTEDDSITLSAYRARLGVAEPVAQPTPTPTPSAIQEQGPSPGVLRREEPQPAVKVELPQVARGGRPAEGGGPEAEVTPAEVQAVKAEVVPETPAPAISEEVELNELRIAKQQRGRLGRLNEERLQELERKLAPAPVPAPAPAPAPAPSSAVTPATEIHAAKLPKDLAGAKPRYNYATAAFMPAFDSDFDRAAFIVTQQVPSKRDTDYLNWALTTSGLTEKQVKAHGVKVRAQLRQMAAGAKGGTQKAPVALKLAPVTIDVAPSKAPAAPAAVPAAAPASTPSAPAGAAGIEERGAVMQRAEAGLARLRPRKQITMEVLLQKTRNEVERLLRDGEITEDQFYQYAKEWNKTTRLGEKMQEGPFTPTPAARAPVTTPTPAPAPAAKTASELAGDLALLRAQKPRPLKRLYGPNPTEKQKAAHKAAMSDWEKQYRKLAQLQKRTLEQENANRTAKVREAVPSEPAQPPAAAGSSMQEGIDNLKFISDPVAKVPGGGMDPKDAKAKLIQQLERALELAPVETIQEYLDTVSAGRTDLEERFKTVNDKNMGAGFEARYRERHELGKKLIAKYGPTVPRVTIEIPGDGTYTIANTKQAINQVLDKARSLNTSMAKGPIKAPAARQKPERAREVPMRLAQQAIQVYGKANAAAKLREQAANTDLELTDQQRTELKVAADMIAPAPAPSAAQSAIDTIDKISKGLSENQYSDPLFLTPLAKLALQIAKRLIQAGVAVEQAIRQAIAQAREQLPNDPADDTQLADRLIRDAQYTEAVAAGDMETAQRMVDEAAKAAGLGESRLNNAGNPEEMYHGSGWSAHNVFERGKSPSGSSKPYPGYGLDDIGFWFTSSKNQATEYGSVLQQEGEKRPPARLYNVFLNIKNPLEFADQQQFNEWIDSYAKIYAVDEKSKTLMRGGRRLAGAVNVNMLLERLKMGKKDGIIIWKGNGDKRFGLKPNEPYPTWAIVFDSNQIKSSDPVTRDDAGNVVPLSQRFQSTTADIRGGRPDSIESALQKVIAATDPRGKSFEAVTALSYVVLNQAAKIALAIYKRTKSWIAARDAGMDYIKSHVQLKNEPETANNFEEFIKGLPNQEIPAGTPELPQPPNPAERVESRGLFLGEIERDTDENWASEARKWVDFYKGNLERAYQVAMTADIDNAFREYVFAELLQRSELEVARAKNDVDLLRALNLQERIANSEVKLGAATGKAMAARKLSQERYWWLQPVLVYRNLVRKRQADAIPFPGVISQQVRKWLVQSGREAIEQVRDAMKQADKVFAREFRKIKAVPGAPGEGPIEINWRDILTKSIDSQGSVRQKMLQVILADPRLRNLSPAGIAEITNLLTNAWETQRNRIFTSEFRKKVPLPTVSVDNREKLFRALPRILRYANIARATPSDVVTTDGPETFLLWEQAFRDAVAPEFGVAEINGATARKLTAMAQEAQRRQGINRNEIIQQMFRLMQREGGVKFSDALRDYWYAAVLSGTRTQVDNALNILNGGLNTAMFAGMSGRDAGLIAYSALKGLDEGIRDFWPMLWRGELYRSVNFNPDQPGNALEGLGESRNLFAKGVSQMKYVSRLIQALDHVTALMSDSAAKAYALRKELGPEAARALMIPTAKEVADARAQAISEGTRPDLVNKRTREILQSKFPTDVLLTSKEIREMVTFTEVPQGLMGSIYEGLNAASRRFPALKFVTGTNFVRFAVNYTNELLNYAAPIAAWRWYKSAPGRDDQPGGLQFSQSRRDLLLAKAAIGTALGAYAAALFLGDDDKEEDRNIDITGSFKSLDPNKRKQLLSEGRQPYSIRFGNTYISYRQFGFGGILGAIGELRDRQLFSPDKWSQESITDKMLDAAAAGLLIVKDSSAISGLTEFLGFANAYKYDTSEVIEKAVPRYVARLAGSLVPNILKEVDAWSDPSIFKAEGGNLGYEYFLQQVPYARREIGPGPILNVLGEPAVVERYPWSRWVKERREDVAWDTLGRLASRGVFMPTPAITVKVNENGSRRQLTREEAYQYQIDVGRGYRKFIEQNSKRLLTLPPDQAAELIDKNADRVRRDAREKLQKSIR